MIEMIGDMILCLIFEVLNCENEKKTKELYEKADQFINFLKKLNINIILLKLKKMSKTLNKRKLKK